MLWILFVCAFVLILTVSKHKRNYIPVFLQRGIFGAVMIFGLDKLFAYFAIELFVGLNVWTLLTSAILGIPGVCLLFGLSFF
jgi:inhibitor of the pro-sigma K processing machinery